MKDPVASAIADPTSEGLPNGPLSRFLLDPWASLRGAGRAVHAFALDALPWIIAGASVAVLALVAYKIFLARRELAMQSGARRIRILPPPEVDPKAAQVLWMGLHSLLRPWWQRLLHGQPRLSWEVSGAPEEIEVGIWVPESVPPGLIERAVEVAFPGARTVPAETDPLAGKADQPGAVEVCELALAEPDWFPIGDPGDDPLGLALASLTGLEDGEKAFIQIVAQPATARALHRIRQAARALRAGTKPGPSAWRAGRGRQSYRPAPDPTLEADVRAILAKASSPLWHCVVRVAVAAPTRAQARGRIHALAGSYALHEGRNGFRRRRRSGGLRAMKRRTLGGGYALSVPELAQIATVPAAGAVAGLERAGARTVPPPRALVAAGRVLGVADHSSTGRPVAISVEDARHHLHVIGETGTGKSTLLANLVLADAAAGRSAIVIDPKGDLVEAILERLPAGAEDRTCVLDPDDRDWAVGLNVLAGKDDDLIVDHILGVFKRIYEPWWGPRTDDIMRAACLTLRQVPGTTLAEVPLLLTSPEWRRAIRGQLGSVVGLSGFWDLYERMQESQRQQHIAPLLNKLRAFLLRGPVRAVVGQPHPKLNIEKLIDDGGLLLVRIPKGTLGEETSRLLGAFVVARVWQACMSRASRPESERADTALYVDEMHNYLALPKSFEDLLAEARGYRLSLVLAHQHMGQLPREMRESLAANARTKVVFACSPEDAHVLERHFRPTLTEHDLSNLATFQAACRPAISGGHGTAFTFRTLPPTGGSPARAAEVRAASASRFAEERKLLDTQIRNRHSELAKGNPLVPPVVPPVVPSVVPPAARPKTPHPRTHEPAGQDA